MTGIKADNDAVVAIALYHAIYRNDTSLLEKLQKEAIEAKLQTIETWVVDGEGI